MWEPKSLGRWSMEAASGPSACTLGRSIVAALKQPRDVLDTLRGADLKGQHHEPDRGDGGCSGETGRMRPLLLEPPRARRHSQ